MIQLLAWYAQHLGFLLNNEWKLPVSPAVNIYDISMYKHFKSMQTTEQQVLSRESLPVALVEVYNRCQKPPNLSAFNPYREDGKDGLKFYTDPSYFFELWSENMNKQAEERKKKKKVC